jgi:hypothetical protein
MEELQSALDRQAAAKKTVAAKLAQLNALIAGRQGTPGARIARQGTVPVVVINNASWTGDPEPDSAA